MCNHEISLEMMRRIPDNVRDVPATTQSPPSDHDTIALEGSFPTLPAHELSEMAAALETSKQ